MYVQTCMNIYREGYLDGSKTHHISHHGAYTHYIYTLR